MSVKMEIFAPTFLYLRGVRITALRTEHGRTCIYVDDDPVHWTDHAPGAFIWMIRSFYREGETIDLCEVERVLSERQFIAHLATPPPLEKANVFVVARGALYATDAPEALPEPERLTKIASKAFGGDAVYCLERPLTLSTGRLYYDPHYRRLVLAREQSWYEEFSEHAERSVLEIEQEYANQR